MPAGDADRIRGYATQLVEDARSRGEDYITLRVGDIHRDLGLRMAQANVGQVLDGRRFHSEADVQLVDYHGVDSRRGSNANFVYEILPINNTQPATVLHHNFPNESSLNNGPQLREDSKQVKIEESPTMLSIDDSEDGIARSLHERIMRLSPDEFERLVGEYLRVKGFSDVEVTGKSYDGGIDGRCSIPFINVKVAFQAKRYSTGNSVGIELVQRLQGSMSNAYDRGVFITTSSFTSAAKGWVEEARAQITLIDGDELVKQMLDSGLGVRTIPVVKHEVDEGFFTDLENQ